MMKRKKGFILYFDVLGYKNYVNANHDVQEDSLQTFLDWFSDGAAEQKVAAIFNKEYIKNKERLLMRCFSDNFFFLYESKSYEDYTDTKQYFRTLNNMMGLASFIQQSFLESGFMIRGSLSFGEVSYNNKIIYGEALVNAVVLEEGHREPSIVIDKYFQSLPDSSLFKYKELVLPFFVWNDSPSDYYPILKGFEKCLSKIDWSSIETPEKREYILYKYKWLLGQLNEYFDFPGKKNWQIADNGSLIEE